MTYPRFLIYITRSRFTVIFQEGISQMKLRKIWSFTNLELAYEAVVVIFIS